MIIARVGGRWASLLQPRSIHTRHTRTVLIALISAIYGTMLLLNGVTVLAPPRLYVSLDVPAPRQARVAWVRPGSALWDRGVRAGGRVLALDGRSPAPSDAGVWMGKRLVARRSDGRAIVIDAVALRQGHDTWPLLMLSPWFFLLGMLVFLRAPRPHVARATCALFVSAACALALAPGTDADQPVAAIAEFALVTLFAAAFVLFFLVFPTPRGTIRRRALLLVPPLVAIALDLAALVWPACYDAASLLRLGILLVYLLLGAGFAIYSFMTLREREARRGLTIICAGTAAAILPFATLYLLPTLLHRPAPLASEQAILALALLPASFTYAILRHNALDVRLLQRWLVHGLLWIGLLAPFTAVVFARRWLLGALPEPVRTLVLAAALALLAALTFRWLYDRLRRALDHLIFRDSYDYRASLQDLSRDLSLAEGLDTLGMALPARLRRLMNLDFAALLVHDGHGTRVCGVAGSWQPAMAPALTEAARAVRAAPQAASLAFGYLTVLLVPLRTRDVVIGHLCLGPKASGEPFRAEDRALLATLSGHLAALVRNAQLVEDLSMKVATLDALNERLQRAREEERARLSADLHDEPLQTALALQREIVIDGRHRAEAIQQVALAQALIAQLRALCTAMRPAALDHLGLPAALDQLTRDQARRAGVPIMLDADPEIMELDLPPAAELVLYRTAQEALNNCLRHARPCLIQVSLQRDETGLLLRVSDDGAGFHVPARFDALVQEGHLGLAGLHERVQRAGGRLRVTSAPREGTIVDVSLPLEAVRV